MVLLFALIALYLLALASVVRDDRPKMPPRSHFIEPVSANDRWERV